MTRGPVSSDDPSIDQPAHLDDPEHLDDKETSVSPTRTDRPHVLRRAMRRARRGVRYARPFLLLTTSNLLSTRSAIEQGGPTVSLTTHGPRLASVHLVLESIARGTVRPGRLVLWLDDPAALASLPAALRRLQRRGLEIGTSQNWGPHTKYWPYVASIEAHAAPLVTADDDWIYPERWLETLLAGWRRHPDDVAAHRVRRIAVDGTGIRPYADWSAVDTADAPASTRHLAVGGFGQLLPPAVLDALRTRGTAFLESAPRADDLWLHHVTIDASRVARPVSALAEEDFVAVPAPRGSVPLWAHNVAQGGNDRQLATTYTPRTLRAIVDDARPASITDPSS